jgi:hypothetical protein
MMYLTQGVCPLEAACTTHATGSPTRRARVVRVITRLSGRPEGVRIREAGVGNP